MRTLFPMELIEKSCSFIMLIFAWCNVLIQYLRWMNSRMDNFLRREIFAYGVIFWNGVQLANINPHEIQKMINR